MRKVTLLISLLLLCLTVLPTMAQDTGIIREPVWGVWTDPEWLKIDYQRVNVTIDNQIATTNVDMQFTNEGNGLAEGTFLFPLPHEASVDSLVMYIDGQAIESKILPADEARAIYDEIVRQHRDPALLEYVGRNAIQANVFPIPVGESRRIQFTYTQALRADNGLISYVFPMNANTLSSRSIGEMSIHVEVTGNDPIGAIYSPSHNLGINRESNNQNGFVASWEAVNFNEPQDFTLFYGLTNENISVNLLSYIESAGEDGFFMLMVQPPLRLPDGETLPKDVIIVLDQSGSMMGDAWAQAQSSVDYVLSNLNPEDRFNVVLFNSGVRKYANGLENAEDAQGAIDWVNSQDATGGTNISGALLTALDLADVERPTSILFLTDGLANEGITATPEIVDAVREAGNENTRIFAFGLGYSVDTFLLDELSDNFKGTSAYVRPDQQIDEAVTSLYNKIKSPVLSNVEIDFGDAHVELMYPQNLTDLFAGEQITLVGRYRQGIEQMTITLTGDFRGESQSITYDDDLSLRDNAGGQSFIARLWATRHIGEMLNTIRLRGENEELIESIVALSVRYGIITPYTSFLIEEDDILSQTGRDRVIGHVNESFNQDFSSSSGAGAVSAAADISALRSSQSGIIPPPYSAPMMMESEVMMDSDGFSVGGSSSEPAPSVNPLTTVKDKTFIFINEVWTDTTFDPDNMTTEKIVFLSDGYFDLLTEKPEIGEYLAVGEQVIVVFDGIAYEVVSE
jgi:Ca-activated chloride channel family protein